MNILFITSSAPQREGDATAPFILTMAEDLQALGHRVTVLAPHAKGSAHKEEIGGVRFVRFSYMWPQGLQQLTDGGSALLQLRRSRWKALLLPCFAIGQALALYQLLRREPFDVLHTHWLLPQGFIAGLLARRFALPHVVMVHGADVFGLQHPFWLWLKKRALRRADIVIANSSATATAVRALNSQVTLEVIPVGATPPAQHQRGRINQASPRVLFIGRLFEGKGLRYLLEALAALPDATLEVLGDGPDRADLQAMAQRLGLAGRVQFAGAVPHARALAALQEADIFVAPSVQTSDGWREAQGNAIVEAMLSGLPVVASDCGGISDAVIHEQTGLLVPQRDAAALVKSIERLTHTPALTAQLAEAGRQHAMLHFTRLGSAKRISALYEKLQHRL